MGLIMLVFEIVEVAIIDRYAQAVIPSTVVLQALFSVLGLVIIGLSASVWMMEYRSQHVPTRHAERSLEMTAKLSKKVRQDVFLLGQRSFFTMIAACLCQTSQAVM